MMNRMTKQVTIFTKIPSFSLLLIFLMISPISHSQAQGTPIECIIVESTGCSICHNTYLTLIKPFWDAYRDNNSISFQLIDVAKPNGFDLFFNETGRLNIDHNAHSLLPWVIFAWNDSQNVIVLDEGDLELVEETFLGIIDDPNFKPTPPEFQLKVLIEQIDPLLVSISGVVIVIELSILLVSIWYYKNRWKQESLLRRISKSRVLKLSSLSFISILTLSYQLLDYIRGGCGCVTSSLIKSLEFRQYEFVSFFGVEIPFSLIGLVLMNAILIQILFIGVIKTPSVIKLFRKRQIVLTERTLNYLHKFLVFQTVCAFFALFYLLYIEIFIVHFICLLCSISQIIIVINTILIVSWRPEMHKQKHLNSENQNEQIK